MPLDENRANLSELDAAFACERKKHPLHICKDASNESI